MMSLIASDIPATVDSVSIAWRDFFEKWPAKLPKRGVVVSTFSEQIPFCSFMLGERVLLLERQTPDASGSRQVVCPLSGVAAVKFTQVVEAQTFKEFGLTGNLSRH